MYSIKPALYARLAVLAALLLPVAVTGCKSTPPPDDNAINTALQARLTGDTAIATEPIQTFVQSGVATLQGTVSSEAAKALAASDASQVSGVKSVVNQLTVQTAQMAPPTAPPQPAPAPPPPAARPSKPTAALQLRPAPKPIAPPPPVAQYNPPPPQPAPAPIERRTPQPPVEAPAPPPAPVRNITVPAEYELPVRITQTLSSATAQPGDSFSGTIATDVVVGGAVAVPAGTAVTGRVDEVHEAAHYKGSALLTLSLVTLNRRGDHISLSTEPYTQQGKGRGANTAGKIGGGAAVGAILGGIFGGGRGAAIGAAAGGGVGAGAQGITRGEQVQIASETLIRFRLINPIDVRVSAPRPSESDANLQPRNSN